METERSRATIGTVYDRPYATLGVARDASATEVRDAYFWLARRHTPEGEPDEFARITAAYRLLSDPGARRRFDAREPFPDEARQALDDAASVVRTAPRRALQLAEAILGQAEQPTPARVAAASLCVAAGAPASADPYLVQVVTESRDDIEASCRLAEAYVQQHRFDDAVRLLDDATARHPRETELFVCLARAHRAAGNLDAAESALRSAVVIQGVRDTRSVPSQFMRLALLAEAGRFAKMHGVASEIRLAIRAGDDDVERHVVSRYAAWAQAATSERSYELAGFLLDRACEIAPTDELRRERDEIAPRAIAQQEAHAALGRTEVPDWIKALLLATLGGAVQDQRFHQLITTARHRYGEAPRTADVQWPRFESDYPAAAAFIRKFRAQIRADVESSQGGVAVAPIEVAPVAAAPAAVAAAPITPRSPAPASGRSAITASRRGGSRSGRRAGKRTAPRPGTRPSARRSVARGLSMATIAVMVFCSMFVRACVREMNKPKPTIQDLMPKIDYSVDRPTREQLDRFERMSDEERDAYIQDLLEEADPRRSGARRPDGR